MDYSGIEARLAELRGQARQEHEARGGRWPWTRPDPAASVEAKTEALVRDLRGLVADAFTVGRRLEQLVQRAEQLGARGLASCGHPANEDGECSCSSWPERAPVASS